MEAIPFDSISRNQSLIRGSLLSIVFVYPLIGMLFLAIGHIRAQLFHARDKLWMVVDNLYISEYVIDKIGQGVCCFCPHHSDAANNRAAHRSLNESEDVLNAASVLGLDAVVPFVLFG